MQVSRYYVTVSDMNDEVIGEVVMTNADGLLEMFDEYDWAKFFGVIPGAGRGDTE